MAAPCCCCFKQSCSSMLCNSPLSAAAPLYIVIKQAYSECVPRQPLKDSLRKRYPKQASHYDSSTCTARLSLQLLLAAPAGFLQAHRKAVLRTVVIAGILSGAAVLKSLLPVSKSLPCPYCSISSYIGWTYFLMWSISFYPQLLINWRRKSVAGVSFDYLAFNVAGFACYSVFNLALKFSPVVQQVRLQDRTCHACSNRTRMRHRCQPLSWIVA